MKQGQKKSIYMQPKLQNNRMVICFDTYKLLFYQSAKDLLSV